MDVTVAQRAHRGLRRLPAYRALGEFALTSPAPRLPARLGEEESPIGVYENIPGSPDQSVLITDLGLHHNGQDGWHFLPYERMALAELEGGEKSPSTNNIAIRLRGGETYLLPVRGGDPTIGTKDTFAMLMFLDHVLGDLGTPRVSHSSHHVKLV